VLTGGLDLVREADRFLIEHKSRFIESLRLAAIVTDSIYDNRRAGLYESFLANMNLSRRVRMAATGPGGSTKTVLTLVAGPTAYYTRADCPRYQGSYGCGDTRWARGGATR
jgi:hypothetical protein